MDPLHKSRIIKREEFPCIGLVDQDALTHLEHQRILERLIIALRYRENFDIDIGAGVLFCGAHEIAHIFQKQKIQTAGIKLFDRLHGHGRVHGAFAACMNLD